MNGNEGEKAVSTKMEVESKETVVYMCGYLPGSVPEKSPILSPSVVRVAGDSWKDVCGGGCGFAMAISDSGKLFTWGSADDESQSYLTSGKHGETPESYPLPTETPVAKAAAGWAHCVIATEEGEVYTWGWKECVPSGKIIHGFSTSGNILKDAVGKQNSSQNVQATLKSETSNGTTGTSSHLENKKDGEETVKRRRISSARQDSESSTSVEENFAVSPRIVTLDPGVKITTVAAGGRHTLVLSGIFPMFGPWPTCLSLSDMGQVWGWGYGGEGQLGLGSRIKMVSSPHLIPCIETRANGKDRSSIAHQGSASSSAQVSKDPGSCIKGIACGGRHSAVITDSGVLLTFGWGMYGQCGQGSTDDQLKPTSVSSLSGIEIKSIAAGLWHTLCISVEGHVYTFGGNQFGQLGTGADQVETTPRLLDAPSLESKHANIVSCGARHSVVLTDDGQVFSWGWNKYGQLGLGDAVDRNIPSQVPPIEGCLPKNIACGWWHTLFVGDKCI